jgi:2-phospho-L-lactate guanylyltransferase
MDPGAAVLIPVKSFADAKGRLAEALSPAERADLAEAMATTVVQAAEPLPVVVVCDSDTVRTWAERVGARVLWTPGLGLNGAVEAGVADLADRGIDLAIVAHSDLPLASEFTWLAEFDGVTLVPDRHLDGTNVIAVPTDSGFRFTYGPASFTAHRAEARRLGLTARIVTDEALSWDVDQPADLGYPTHLLEKT